MQIIIPTSQQKSLLILVANACLFIYRSSQSSSHIKAWFILVSQGFSHPLLFQYHLSVPPINRSALWVMCLSYTLSIDAVASVFVMKCSRICASRELIYFKYNLLKLSKLVVQMWGSDTVTESVCMYEYKCCFDIMEKNNFETINNLLLIQIFLWNGEKKIWKITEFRFGTCWWTNSYFHLKFENMNLIFNWTVSLNRIFKCLFYRYKSTK